MAKDKIASEYVESREWRLTLTKTERIESWKKIKS